MRKVKLWAWNSFFDVLNAEPVSTLVFYRGSGIPVLAEDKEEVLEILRSSWGEGYVEKLLEVMKAGTQVLIPLESTAFDVTLKRYVRPPVVEEKKLSLMDKIKGWFGR